MLLLGFILLFLLVSLFLLFLLLFLGLLLIVFSLLLLDLCSCLDDLFLAIGLRLFALLMLLGGLLFRRFCISLSCYLLLLVLGLSLLSFTLCLGDVSFCLIESFLSTSNLIIDIALHLLRCLTGLLGNVFLLPIQLFLAVILSFLNPFLLLGDATLIISLSLHRIRRGFY